MKIFAKRKRKSGGGTPAAKQERTSFASDPLVEELLKKDPSGWNSKEKRMVARYQKRKEEHDSNDQVDEAAEDNTPDADVEPQTKPKESEKGEPESKKESGSDSSDSESDDDEMESNSEKEEVKEQALLGDKKETNVMEETEKPPEKEMNVETEASNSDEKEEAKEQALGDKKETEESPEKETNIVTETSNSDGNCQEGKVDPDNAIWKLLDKLNSKMKRTLSRKLERAGATVLDEVRKEANLLLGVSDENSSKKRGQDQVEAGKDGESKGGKKKRRKVEVDLSKLPPEERLRREDQRKKQKEAAERVAKGEDKTPGYKHPLNSERRRANKRKPKWKKDSKENVPKRVPKDEYKNEHDTSGFQVRKQKS